MRRINGLVVAVTVMVAATTFARDIPKLQARVNDTANILKPTERNQLEKYLAAEEEKSSNQIVVLTIASLDGEEIMPYTQKVFREWKLGDKQKNNGVLLLVALKERKMRIHTGRGLEGALPDGLCWEIIDDEMKPLFKQSKYYDGINTGVQKIVGAIHGEYKGKAKAAAVETNYGKLTVYVILLIVVYIVCAMISEDPSLLGGIVGAVGAGVITYFFYSFLLAILATFIGFIIGAFARRFGEGAGDVIIVVADTAGSSSGGGSSSYSGGGGDSGGGGADGGW
ncbi:MAG: hypothetical protein K0S38_18 [Candidatus Paceibacter sp.]|jgi:uncharacterized protein|nr:hypothetical protein [Candidatus Paceibacter sp.]